MLLDLVIKFLNVSGRESRQLAISYEPFDLILRLASVAIKRAFSDGEYHILVEPLVHPLAECHSAIFGEVNVTVQLYDPSEFLQLFKISIHRSEREVGIVAF